MTISKKDNHSDSQTYTGLFIRDSIAQTANEAGTDGWTNSPDIICNGNSPISDPATLTSSDNYNSGQPNKYSQVPQHKNFVYIRGKNTNAPQLTSTVYLYYAPASISLLPTSWQTAGIEWNGQTQNKAVITVGANKEIVVTTPALLWTPPKIGEHYCMVAWARNDVDQATPPTLPTLTDWAGLGRFILDHPNVAWRNMAELPVQNNVFQKTVEIDNPPAGGSVSLGISFDKVPPLGHWEMTVPRKDKPAFHRKGVVKALSEQPYFVAFPVDLPKDWKTTLTFKYTLPTGGKIPPHASIEAVAISGLDLNMVAEVKTKAPHRLVELHDSNDADNSGDKISYGMVVGSVRYKLIG
jgi:hypothetical protein